MPLMSLNRGTSLVFGAPRRPSPLASPSLSRAARACILSFRSARPQCEATPSRPEAAVQLDRRTVAALLAAPLLASLPQQAAAAGQPAESNCESCSNSNSALEPGDKAFVTFPSGLRILDLREGTGPQPSAGQTCVVEWVGYTAGYQAKRIESTRETDTPFVFTLGKGEAIPAFEEAITGMKQGGVRRVEIPGELVEELGYSKQKEQRYVAGPVPQTFAGRRALDFVLDNQTLRDFNRTLLFDIRLSKVRPS